MSQNTNQNANQTIKPCGHMTTPSQKMNVAILGAGNIARSMATALQGIQNEVNLYAVASRDIAKANAFQEIWGFRKSYGSYEELAADDQVDLIYIATPHSEHHKNAMLCLEHGRNCLIEKAFCSNRAQAQELINLAQKNHCYLAEAMWTRYTPARAITEGLIAEYIGDIQSIDSEFSEPLMHIERLVNPALAGGALLDIGIYPLTVAAMYIKDEIDHMDITHTLTDRGIDSTDEITITYKNGATAIARCSIDKESTNYATIRGSKGSLHYEFIQAPSKINIYDINGTEIHSIDIPMLVNGYEYEVLEAKKMICAGKTMPESIPWEETLRMMGLMDEIRARTGVVYPWE